MADKQYSINGDLKLDDHDFKKKMGELDKGVDKFAKQFDKSNKDIGKGFDKNKKKVKEFGGSVTKQFAIANIASTSLMKGMYLLRSSISNVAGEYIKLDKNLAKVRTLTQDTEFSTAMFRDELFRVSEATGYFASDLAEASYQALSAGVAIEELGGFISQMGVLAKGGFTDVTTAVDATTSIMNAYGKEVYTAVEISDKLIASQNRGKTTVNELGGSVALFIPIAAQLGVELDEVLGMMASITRVGVPTAQAATQISRVMLELADSTSGAGKEFIALTGKSFPAFAKEGGNLTQALKILKIGAEESGRELITMFGRAEAGKAAVVLMKDNADDLATSIESVGSSAGAADRANKIATTNVADEWSKLKVSMINDIAEIGKAQEGFWYKTLKIINETNKERKEVREQFQLDEEIIQKRTGQLQKQYEEEGLNTFKAYTKAREEAMLERSQLGTKGLIDVIKEETIEVPKSQRELIAEEQKLQRADRQKDRQKEIDDKAADELREKLRLKKLIEDKKTADKKAAKDAIAAKKLDAEETKLFREGQQIEEAEFNTQQLTKQFNFIQAQAEMRDQGKITNEEFEKNAKEFLNDQLLETDRLRIEELEKEAEYFKNKEGHLLDYNKTLEKLKAAELKLLKDGNKNKYREQKEEFKLNSETEKFTKATYRALMSSHGNFLKDMASFFKDYLAQLMIEKGEGLVVKGTTDVLEGIAINANPLTLGAGTPLIAAGGAEIAQGLVYGAAGAAISSIDLGGAEDGETVRTGDSTSVTEAKMEDLEEKEEKPTITYMVPEDSQFMEMFMPKLGQALKDGKNIVIIPSK